MRHGNKACGSISWRKSLEHWKSGNHPDVQNKVNFLGDISDRYCSKFADVAHKLKV